MKLFVLTFIYGWLRYYLPLGNLLRKDSYLAQPRSHPQ
jgi:hypothetical protein